MSRKYILAPYITEDAVADLRVSDLLRMTHLNIAFGLVNNCFVTVDHLRYLERIAIYKRINPELNVILSIGGWGADGFSQAAMTQTGREMFARSTFDILEKWDFDGVDIDWEYPCEKQADIAADPRDKENFTALMRELRITLDIGESKNGKHYLLSCAVGGEQYFIDGTEMDKVAEIADFINLMTYDLRGGFTNIAGHHTPLYPQSGDPNGSCGVRTVELFHNAGVPYEKMVLGAAFYSRRWCNTESKENNGLGSPAQTTGTFGPGYDGLRAEYINKGGFTRYWDETASAPYLFNGTDFISYEDEMSLKAKCRYVAEKGLAGIMYWSYGSHELFDVLVSNLE